MSSKKRPPHTAAPEQRLQGSKGGTYAFLCLSQGHSYCESSDVRRMSFFFLGGFYFELLQIIIRLTDGQGGFFPFTTLKKAVDIYEGLLTFQQPISLNEVLTMIDVASLSTLDLALRK